MVQFQSSNSSIGSGTMSKRRCSKLASRTSSSPWWHAWRGRARTPTTCLLNMIKTKIRWCRPKSCKGHWRTCWSLRWTKMKSRRCTSSSDPNSGDLRSKSMSSLSSSTSSTSGNTRLLRPNLPLKSSTSSFREIAGLSRRCLVTLPHAKVRLLCVASSSASTSSTAWLSHK